MSESEATIAPLVLQTVQDMAADRLRRLILSGQLLPGQRLVQTELAELLGVSRTPVRDALKRLEHDGLVTLTSYKGASVARFSAADLDEVYAIRTALESHATYLAARHITTEGFERLDACLREMASAFRQGDFEHLLQTHHAFHVVIYEAAAPPRFLSLIRQHLELSNVYQRMALSMGRGAKDPVVEHQDILAILRRREADAAGAQMRDHLEMTARELLELFEE